MEGNGNTTAHSQIERLARLIWVLAFVVPLLLAALLLGVKSAQADSASAARTPLVYEGELELEEEDEGELAEEECEFAEEEAEEGEITPAEAKAICKEANEAQGETSSADECPLHSARAHAAVTRSRLKLTLGYTTVESVKATIQVSAGSTKLGTFKRHLGKSGVLRFSIKLTERPSGKRVLVRIQLPASESAGCPSRRLVLFPS